MADNNKEVKITLTENQFNIICIALISAEWDEWAKSKYSYKSFEAVKRDILQQAYPC